MMTSPAERSSICIPLLLRGFRLKPEATKSAILAYKNRGQTRGLAPEMSTSAAMMEVEKPALDAPGSCKLPRLEAFLAEDRPTLRGPEGHRGVLAARRAGRLGFDPFTHRGPRTRPVRPFGFAVLTTFRLVLELLVRKEKLFARCPDELRRAGHATQTLVLELHRSPPRARRPSTGALLGLASELLTVSLPRQSLLGPAFVTRLQIERVLLDV